MRQRGFEVVDLKHRKHNGDIKLPQRADYRSCGYDWYSPCEFTIKPNQQKLISTDIKAYMLDDEMLMLNVRSSQGKIRIQLANTQGWIDSSYYNNPDNNGNIAFFIRNEGTEEYVVKEGDRIMQGMFTKYLVTDDDTPIANDRLGGFGSSGL